MARVHFRLPPVLRPISGQVDYELDAVDVPGAFEALFEQAPILRQHLVGEGGELRPHLLCLRNGTNLLRHQILSEPLEDGDEVLIHQAISGG